MRIAPAIAIVALLTLTGCGPDRDPVLPDPEPSASPIFASDEEALAAAEEAYGAYLAASDEVLAAGAVDPEPLYAFLADEYRKEATAGLAHYVDRGWHTSGASSFDSVQLQQYADAGDGVAEIVIYLCVDVSQLRILDASSNDVTPQRQDRIPLEVQFRNSSDYSAELVQIGSEVWSGEDFCS